MKKYLNWKDVPKGTKFKVVRNTNGHNYPLNTTLTTKKNKPFGASASDVAVEFTGNSLHILDCQFSGDTISEIKKQQKELQEQITILNSKIKLMEELELDEYDENVIKVHQTLTLIDKKGISKIEKAKAIAKLINED